MNTIQSKIEEIPIEDPLTSYSQAVLDNIVLDQTTFEVERRLVDIIIDKIAKKDYKTKLVRRTELIYVWISDKTIEDIIKEENDTAFSNIKLKEVFSTRSTTKKLVEVNECSFYTFSDDSIKDYQDAVYEEKKNSDEWCLGTSLCLCFPGCIIWEILNRKKGHVFTIGQK